jgi:hypothetical protein
MSMHTSTSRVEVLRLFDLRFLLGRCVPNNDSGNRLTPPSLSLSLSSGLERGRTKCTLKRLLTPYANQKKREQKKIYNDGDLERGIALS